MEYYGSLLKHCIQILEEFQANNQNLDVYLDNYFSNKKLDENDRNFIEEVFSGVTRYKKFNKILLDAFYKSGSMPLITDMKLFSILSYLFFIRVEELTWAEFENFVLSQSPLRMRPFFDFLSDRKNLEPLVEAWLEFYDTKFVEGTIFAQIDQYRESMSEFAGRLQRRSEGSSSRRTEKKEVTVPLPFQLTQPKPKAKKEFVLQKIEARPVPKEKYADHEKFKKNLEKKKEENKKIMEEKYKNYQPPQFLSEDRVKEKPKEEEVEYEQFKASPMPAHILIQNEELNDIISGNKGAILRQEAHYRKKQEQIEQVMKNYETGGRDSASFMLWQQEMKEKEEQERIAIVEKRKFEKKAIKETLAEAKEKVVDENKLVAKSIKDELRVIEKSKEKEKIVEGKQKKAVVGEVRQMSEKVKIAKTGVAKMKQEKVAEVQKDLLEKKQQSENDQRQERLEKEDLIKQIRAIEKHPRSKAKFYNPSEVTGPGYFSDMSLTELNARLEWLQEQNQKDIEEKREKIMGHKKNKDDELKKKADSILAIRRQMEEDSTKRREEKRKQIEEKSKRDEEAKEKAMLEMHEKMEKLRTERLGNLHKISEEKLKTTQKLDEISGGKSGLEERKFRDLELAEERAAKERQDEQRRLAEAFLEVKEREAATRKQGATKQSTKKSETLLVQKKNSPRVL